jgi:hypothetical protein
MLIKALRSSFGDHGMVRRGQIIDVLDHQAQQLVKRGLYEGVKMEAGRDGDNPLSRAGGRTGKAKPPSSSLEGHQPQTPTLQPAETAAASSRSTIRGGSHHGQTSSTPATSHGGKRQKESLSSGE